MPKICQIYIFITQVALRKLILFNEACKIKAIQTSIFKKTVVILVRFQHKYMYRLFHTVGRLVDVYVAVSCVTFTKIHTLLKVTTYTK